MLFPLPMVMTSIGCDTDSHTHLLWWNFNWQTCLKGAYAKRRIQPDCGSLAINRKSGLDFLSVPSNFTSNISLPKLLLTKPLPPSLTFLSIRDSKDCARKIATGFFRLWFISTRWLWLFPRS
jgi:hypothetical protein